MIFFPWIRYQGHIGAYLVLAGVDFDGPHLFSIAAHGSTDKVPFAAMGSGMLSAMSILVSTFLNAIGIGSIFIPIPCTYTISPLDGMARNEFFLES